MKKLKVLKDVFLRTGAYRILVIFVVVFLLTAFLVMVIEPTIDNYGDALWICFSAVSTIGFGDILVTYTGSRILIVILQVYAFVVFGVLAGVVVAFYNKIYERALDVEIDVQDLDDEDSFLIQELIYDALNDPKYENMTMKEIKEHFKNRRAEILVESENEVHAYKNLLEDRLNNKSKNHS